jgi:hypothetical protein
MASAPAITSAPTIALASTIMCLRIGDRLSLEPFGRAKSSAVGALVLVKPLGLAKFSAVGALTPVIPFGLTPSAATQNGMLIDRVIGGVVSDCLLFC